MFGFGMPELIIILIIALVILGPGKLPQVGAALGGAIRSFKSAAEEDPKLPGNAGNDKKDGQA